MFNNNYGGAGGYSLSDIAAATGNGNDGFGNGNSAWWIIILFLFAFGGLGNGYGGGFGNDGGRSTGVGFVPYTMNVNNDVQRGFDQSALMGAISTVGTNVVNGFSDAAVSQCNQTTGILNAINGVQNTLCNNKFDLANAITNTGYSLNNTLMQNEMARQQCCCDTKQAIADVKYTIATENCADRAVLNDALRDVIASNTANTQAILDKLCQQEIDAKNTEIANLRTQLNMQNLAASQGQQTSALIADNNAQTRDLINRIAPAPVPAYVVANPYAYNYNGNCGCGCGSCGI